jgi:hypothetical protein
MPPEITLYGTLIFLFYAIVLGFGFAIGGWLWSVVLSAFRRG